MQTLFIYKGRPRYTPSHTSTADSCKRAMKYTRVVHMLNARNFPLSSKQAGQPWRVKLDEYTLANRCVDMGASHRGIRRPFA